MGTLNPSPVLEVSHLPSAASYYAAITQSLGLQYLSSASSSPTCLYFGHHDPTTNAPVTLFVLRQASLSTPPQRTLITLAAPSPTSVETFYKKALLANNSQKGHAFERTSDEDAKATIEDLDGNMLEAVYSSRTARHAPAIHTASTANEARRVLAWQHEVAKSTAAGSDVVSSAKQSVYDDPGPPPYPYRRADSYPALPQQQIPLRLVRRETVTAERYWDRDAAEGGGGFTGMKAVGMLLGAAAGAAVAYAMVRSESPPRMPPPARRASYGDHGSQYTHTRHAEPIERGPPRSYVSVRDAPPPRYLEHRPAPPPAPSQALAYDIARIDERSYASQRSARDGERVSRVRASSEVGSRRSRVVTEPPQRARSPSPRSHVSYRSHVNGSHHSKRDTDRESFVSARSQRMESTVKPIPSRAPTTTMRMAPRDERRSEVTYTRNVPLPRSEVSARNIPLPGSEVNARHVPLPRSVVSGRGYAASVAPSDSVSSVGSKRERERLRERMRERDRW